MSVYRSVIAGIGVVAVTAGAMLTGLGQTPAPAVPQLPGAPMATSGSFVTPRLEGWFRNADGTATIIVGYFNRNQSEVLDVAVGPNNKIEPGGPDQGQPTHFLTGRQWGMFSVTVPKDFGTKKLTWTVVANGQPASITLWINPPYNVSPLVKETDGNTPPVARFDPAGPELKGPPRGIAKTYSAAVGAPLTLTVWVKDAGPTFSPNAPAPPAAGRSRPGGPGGGPGAGPGAGGPGAGRGPTNIVRMAWARYRGPAEPKFANPRPTIDAAADGKAETTVTFPQAGEYWLRAQFNDSSGEGGGGDQCCWSSALVKVNVK